MKPWRRRTLGLCSLCLAVLLLPGGAALRGEDHRTPEELAKAADEFAHGYDQTQWKNYPGALKALAQEVAKLVGCDEAATKALVEGAKPIGDQLPDHWRAVYRAYYLSHQNLPPHENWWDGYPAMLTGERCRAGIVKLQAQWDQLLSKCLTPSQLTRWRQEVEVRRLRRVKSGDAWIRLKTDKTEKAVRKAYEKRAESLAQALAMPKERAGALGAAVDAAVAAHDAVTFDYARRCQRGWDEDFLNYRMKDLEHLEQGGDKGGDFTLTGAAGVAADTAFDKAVAGLLLPAEEAGMKAYKEGLRQRLAKAARGQAERWLQEGRTRLQSAQEARVDRLVAAVGLDEARRRQLQDRLNHAEKIIDDDWTRDFIANALKGVDPNISGSDLEKAVKQLEEGRHRDTDSKAEARIATARMTAWEAALKDALTPEQRARFDGAEERDNERRARILATVAVAELDHQLLLLPEQRTAIEKLALEAAKPISRLPGGILEMWSEQLLGSLLLMHAIGLPKVEALLQERQKKEFQALVEHSRYQWAEVEIQLRKKT